MSLLPDIPSGKQGTALSKTNDKLYGPLHTQPSPQNEKAHERLSPSHTRTDSDACYYDYFMDVSHDRQTGDSRDALGQTSEIEPMERIGSSKRNAGHSAQHHPHKETPLSHKEGRSMSGAVATTTGNVATAAGSNGAKGGDHHATPRSMSTPGGTLPLPSLIPVKALGDGSFSKAGTSALHALSKNSRTDAAAAPPLAQPQTRSPPLQCSKKCTSEEEEDEEDEICLASAPYSMAWEEYPSCYFSTSARLLTEEEVLHMNPTAGVADVNAVSSTLGDNGSCMDANSWGDLQPTLEIPRIVDETLGELNEIGVGGDRGSVVYRVARPQMVRKGTMESFGALKMYPQHISDHEIEFSRLLYNIQSEYEAAVNRNVSPRAAVDKTTKRSNSQPRRRLSQRTLAQAGVQHLVVPEAIVVTNGEERGLFMPLYECSLRTFLHQHGQQYVNRQTDNSGMHSERRTGAFLWQARFEPIANMEVVTAIVFQVLCAIDLMNHNMLHTIHNKQVGGYNHNDIHLDNVLVMPSGHIALCDFELVSHRKSDEDKTTSLVNFTRLPPPSRQSPHGLFHPTADTWATGLVILNLLTGVDPLFSNDILMDDFGSGPLLMPYNNPGRGAGVSVLDWEENIQRHAKELLDAIDPSCGRLEEAGLLLELCSHCLVNRAGQQPMSSEELLKDPMFATYQASPDKAKAVVKKWMEELNAKKKD